MSAADLFGAGAKVAVPPLATTMRASTAFALVIDHGIRCQGERRGQVCGKLLAERAARPHTHVCPRCGHRNDTT